MMKQALKGVKILEYCETISGAYCAKLMADLGAEVIKIEKPKVGDSARSKPPFKDNDPNPEKSGLFAYINTSKLGITLDPSTNKGKEIFEQLVLNTDVLLDDHATGEMETLNLGYEDLKKLNSGLIM